MGKPNTWVILTSIDGNRLRLDFNALCSMYEINGHTNLSMDGYTKGFYSVKETPREIQESLNEALARE